MSRQEAQEHLDRARVQYDRCVAAAGDPVDWPELAVWSFYCLENGVMAAALFFGLEVKHTHLSKQKASADLHRQHGLPEVEILLSQLNEARKAATYGDVEMPELDPEELVSFLDHFLEAVAAALSRDGSNAL